MIITNIIMIINVTIKKKKRTMKLQTISRDMWSADHQDDFKRSDTESNVRQLPYNNDHKKQSQI